MTAVELEKQYTTIAPLAQLFSDELVRQLEHLIKQESLVLSFPIQSRVKEWQSITEKIERKSLNLGHIAELSRSCGHSAHFAVQS